MTFLRQPDWYLGERIGETATALGPVLTRIAPRWLYVPHAGERHPDHRATLAISRAALGGTRVPLPAVLGYEVWTPLADGDELEDITPVMRSKLLAVHCYPSQLQQFPYDRAVRGLNQYRGALYGRCRYAELFQSAAVLETSLAELPFGGQS